MKRKSALFIAWALVFSIFWNGIAAFAETAPTAAPTPLPEAAAPTSYGTQVDATIRVLLQSLGTRQALGLTVDGAYTIDGDRGFQIEPGTEIQLGVQSGRITLRAGGVSIDMGGGFTLKRHLTADGQAGGIYIHESEKQAMYRGDLSFGVSGGYLRIILTIGVEEYLYGVLPYEMSDTFPLEALKAQAVAARTYTMQRKTRSDGQLYDVVDTANDQVFKGYDVRYTRPIQAVDETRGVVCVYKGSFAECFYSASNGGQTALASDVWDRMDDAYLDIRDDPYDLANPESLVRYASVPKDAAKMDAPLYGLLAGQAGLMLQALGKLKPGEEVGLTDVLAVEAVKPVYGGESRQYGTLRFTVRASVRRLAENGQYGPIEEIEAPLIIDLSLYDQVRGALNLALNSSNYEMITVAEKETAFTLAARRYGHGVGMSQRGAQRMAGVENLNFLQILHFYYPGVTLVQIDWLERPLTAVSALPESLGYAAPRPTPVPTPAPLPPLSGDEFYAVVKVEGVDSTLNVREGPSTGDTILGVLRNGTRMIVEAILEGGWAKMKTAEIEGYVSMTFIVREDSLPLPSPDPAATPQPGETEQPEKEGGASFAF